MYLISLENIYNLHVFLCRMYFTSDLNSKIKTTCFCIMRANTYNFVPGSSSIYLHTPDDSFIEKHSFFSKTVNVYENIFLYKIFLVITDYTHFAPLLFLISILNSLKNQQTKIRIYNIKKKNLHFTNIFFIICSSPNFFNIFKQSIIIQGWWQTR